MPLSVNRLRSRGTSSPENVQLGEVLVCFCIVDTVRRVGKSLFKTLGHPAKERFDRSLGLSRQLHRLHLWQKEFSRSPIRFILCTAGSLRSWPTDTIGGNTASRFTRLLIRCGRCLRPGPALLPLIPVSS